MNETPLEKNLREINERQEREELRRQGKLPGQAKEEAKQLFGCFGMFGLAVIGLTLGLLILIKILN